MAINMLYRYSTTREIQVVSDPTDAGVVATGVDSGQPIKRGSAVGVTLTASGGRTPNSDGTGAGGVGNAPGHATVAFDGTFILPVTGVTASTAQGTPVYIPTATDGTGALTLTSGSGTQFGVVDGWNNTATACAVKVGA